MAHYNVTIEYSEGYRDADPDQVNFSSGDTITFTADSAGGCNLCFTAATAAILSPTPALCVPLAAGASASYTFTSAAAGVYFSQVMPDQVACPSTITGTESDSGALLVILPGEDPGYDGGSPDTPTGN